MDRVEALTDPRAIGEVRHGDKKDFWKYCAREALLCGQARACPECLLVREDEFRQIRRFVPERLRHCGSGPACRNA